MVTRPIALAGGLLFCAALTGCGDSRLRKLTVGIGRDSALKVMRAARPEQADAYIVGGHYIETLYFAPPGVDSGKTAKKDLSPVVVVDGVVAGWGWGKWGSIAAANKIVIQK